MLVEKPTSGVAGALVRSGLVSAPSALAGVEAMGITAPLAAASGPLGRLAIPLISGMAGSLAASSVTNKMLPEETTRQLQEDASQHPIATLAGGAAANLPFFRPGISPELLNRAKAAAIGSY